MKTKVEEKFSEFYEKWVDQLEEHVEQLVKVMSKGKQQQPSEVELQLLVNKVTTHYKKYYTVKWAQAHEDVVAFFCPVWLSPLENAYAWVTGWKPSMVFRVVSSMANSGSFHGGSLGDMSEDQARKIEELRVRIKMEEEKVEREMERQQVAMADKKMLELAQLERRVRSGELACEFGGLLEAALKELLVGLEKVMKAADCVRLKSLKGVLDVLSPLQRVELLAGVSTIQIQLKEKGKEESLSAI